MKKPTLATHSKPCCGECIFCAKDTEGDVRCHLNPPRFMGFEGEYELHIRPKVSVQDTACQSLNRGNN